MTTGFTKKRLDLTITLGTGAFGETVGDTVTLSGYRMTADILIAGGESMGAMQLRVFGLSETMMNKLTTIGQVATAIRMKNKILLAAGDDESGMRVVYQGTIDQAWADYNSAPDVAFNVIAYAGLDAAVKPVNAISFRGSADVATIMESLAKTMGLAFENKGVSAKLSNPYFPGTALAQVKSCARAADIWYTIDRGALVIWPKKSANLGTMPLISPETGLIGYPAFSSKGMSFSVMFNQDIRLPGKILMKSSIPMACGEYNVYKISHALSSEIANGPWFSNVECYKDV